MQRDFLVCERYGTADSVAAGAHGVFPLLPAPDFASIDPGIPDGDAYDIYIHRIVGQVLVYPGSSADSIHNFGWRIMPLGMDETAGDVDIPFTLFDMDDEDQANLQWWGERRVRTIANAAGDAFGGSTLDHYRWAHVDLHPKRWCGQKKRIWPCLLFRNYNIQDSLTVFRRLRLYVSYV